MARDWPLDSVRAAFFSHFEENQHSRLSSSPVIPVEDPSAHLFHSCLNRFKGTFDGAEHLDCRRCTCYSLRCILATDDADVMDRYRADKCYHRFTEILGSWSYGAYFKEDAVRLLWSLLVKKYKLPQHKIYVTYFKGDVTNGLKPDNESRNILRKHVHRNKIFASMEKADFWTAGPTGPCGPCVAIFFDQDGVSSRFNINDDRFIEICRIVFVEFNRQADGVLGPLLPKHALTGINVECLAAILQNKESHYDLDVFKPIFDAIQYCGDGIGSYSGKVGSADTIGVGVDTAYRLLGDHFRMISAATAFHAQIGGATEGREYFLKCADKLAMDHGHCVLNIIPDKYKIVLNVALRTSDLCPALKEDTARIACIIENEMKIFKKTLAEILDKKMLTLEKLKKTTKKKPVDESPVSNVTEDIPPVVWYRTRIVEFLGRPTPIILKDKDKHCSLVPLCNALLLAEKMTLNLDVDMISEDHLIYFVQRCLLYGNIQMQLQHDLELSEFQNQVLFVLPKLRGFLYFSITFASINGFKQRPVSSLFEVLGVPLHHGWLVNPQDSTLRSPILQCSYFKHSKNLSVYESLLPDGKSFSARKEDEKFAREVAYSNTASEVFQTSDTCKRFSTFMHGPQLTKFGFSCLLDGLKANMPSILIWNERLNTIVKVEDKMYVLVNDLTISESDTEIKPVWERVTQESNAEFVDCNFAPVDTDIKSTLPLNKKERKKKQSKKAAMNLDLLSGVEEKTEEKEEMTEEEATVSDRLLKNGAPQVCFSQRSDKLSTKAIDFLGRATHVIYQNKNGPCPLIAICNDLLLKGKMCFEPNENEVSIEYLTSLVQGFLNDSKKFQVHSPEEQKAISDIVPTLGNGLDVDVVFSRTDAFTRTPEYYLLDCLDISLRHGWLGGVLLSGFETQSYELITLTAKEPDFPDAGTVQEFLRGPQLTPLGLVSLQKDLIENVPYILYKDKHYSTLIKFDRELYTLVTDSGFLESNIFWQTLHEVNGDEVFVDSRFSPLYPVAFTLDPNFQLNSVKSVEPEKRYNHLTEEVISLAEFLKHPGNGFASKRTLFPKGASLTVADTTVYGRVFGLQLLEDIWYSHCEGSSWDGNFDLTTIDIIGKKRAEISAPHCSEFNYYTRLNDFKAYITEIVELFRIQGVGLPAFFSHLVRILLSPPREPPGMNTRENKYYSRELRGFWGAVLTTLALRSSSKRTGFFSGLHKIRNMAPSKVRLALAAVLDSRTPLKDWRLLVTRGGHPLQQKVMRHIPSKSSSHDGSTKGGGPGKEVKDGDPGKDIKDGGPGKEVKYGASGKQGNDVEDEVQKFGLFRRGTRSLSIFPRHFSEHGINKERGEGESEEQRGEGESEEQRGEGETEEEEDLEEISDLDLLCSHYLQDVLPDVLNCLLCSDEQMTPELWKWVQEILEEYNRPEPLSCPLWSFYLFGSEPSKGTL